MTYRNLAITFLLVGLWHGAKWTMIAFGIYWAVLLITHRILKPFLSSLPSLRSSFVRKISFIVKVIFFFQLISLGMLIFRAQSVKQAFEMLASTTSVFHPSLVFEDKLILLNIITYVWFLIIVQLFQFYRKNLMIVTTWPPIIIAIFYGILLYWITFYSFVGQKFIYFEF